MWNNCKVYIYGNECLRQRFLINDLYVHCKLLTKICKIWYWNICARIEFITSVLVKLKVRIWKLDSSVRILFLYVSDNLLNVLSKCKEHLLSMKKVFLFFPLTLVTNLSMNQMLLKLIFKGNWLFKSFNLNRDLIKCNKYITPS